MQGKALPGFRDFYPEELALRNHIFAIWRSVATRYGFEEYDGPPLETLELYTQKSGDEIVQQLYAFRDKGDREVALRPEMTPTLARMVAAHAHALKKPIRWFSMPQLFRYERQQRGRLREHFQLNMDIIGEAGPLADAELIAAAIDIMRAFGFGPKDVQARISDRRVLRALLLGHGVSETQLPATYAAIDKADRVPQHVLIEIMREAVGDPDPILKIAKLKSLDAVSAALAKVKGGGAAAHGHGGADGDGAGRVRAGGPDDRPRPGVLHRDRVRAVRQRQAAACDLWRWALRRPAQGVGRTGPPRAGLRHGRRRARRPTEGAARRPQGVD